MELNIYVDILFFVNFIIDGMLLSITAFILKKEVKVFKLILSSVVGGIYGSIIYFISINILFLILLQLSISLIMILILFSYSNLKVLLKYTVVFITMSFIFGGCILGICTFTPLGSIILINNGVSYLDVSFIAILIFGLITYILIAFLSKTFTNSNLISYYSKVEVFYNNKSVKINGFTDTGNLLNDNISGLPIVISEFNAIKILIPKELHNFFKGDFNKFSDTPISSKIRLIPYKGIWKNEGLIVCFKPDYIITTLNNKVYKSEVLIGIVDEPLSLTGEYSLLLHPDVFTNEEVWKNWKIIKH